MISANFAYLAVLVIMFTAMIWRLPAENKKKALKSFGIWGLIIFCTVVVYSFRFELMNTPVFASLFPGYGYTTGDAHELNFKKASDGHFYINAVINNVSIKFLVDTGASDTVLSPSDARKIGLDVRNLDYTKFYNTANGLVKAAPVLIQEIGIRDIRLNNVTAAVNQVGLEHSLMGMSALSDFAINIDQDRLQIRY